MSERNKSLDVHKCVMIVTDVNMGQSFLFLFFFLLVESEGASYVAHIPTRSAKAASYGWSFCLCIAMTLVCVPSFLLCVGIYEDLNLLVICPLPLPSPGRREPGLSRRKCP